jgi:hypothetical protein
MKYGKNVTAEEQASLPECPTRPSPMSEEELRAAVGGMTCEQARTWARIYWNVGETFSNLGDPYNSANFTNIGTGIYYGGCN